MYRRIASSSRAISFCWAGNYSSYHAARELELHQQQASWAAAIEAYDGTVLFVSHDRYFLGRIADRIVEVRDGGATASEGGYSTWYARRRAA